MAVYWGCEKVVEKLLEKGANIEAVDPDQRTALHIAAHRGREEVVEKLLEKGANIEAVDQFRQRALDIAHSQKRSKIITLLSLQAQKNNPSTQKTPTDSQNQKQEDLSGIKENPKKSFLSIPWSLLSFLTQMLVNFYKSLAKIFAFRAYENKTEPNTPFATGSSNPNPKTPSSSSVIDASPLNAHLIGPMRIRRRSDS